MGRLLGIDFGTKRIGLAVSDPLGIIARPLETIINDSTTIDKINKQIRDFNIEAIVVGLPFNLKGERGQKAQEVEAFIEQLKNSTQLPVFAVDERFTSTTAKATLLQMGVKKKQRQDKSKIDLMAAALILQSYLDSAPQK
ncbi:MAG: Holliday junction resolvase RuvX [Bacteroidota bacterium]|nr:Holliday junction resolvase RuvX [Bacteroidota bacterium]